jgi:hypothetical protein
VARPRDARGRDRGRDHGHRRRRGDGRRHDTYWDPFTSHEVVIKAHCTWDTNQAVVKDIGKSPF